MCDRQESVAESMDGSTCLSSAVLRSTQGPQCHLFSSVFKPAVLLICSWGPLTSPRTAKSHSRAGLQQLGLLPPHVITSRAVTRAHLHFRKIRLHSWPQISKSTRSSVQLVGFMSEPAIQISKAVSPATSSSLGS